MVTDPSVDAILCVGCGYDLRSLPADGACPECGRPIAESLGGRRLAAADTRWLSHLVIGQTMVTWGLHLALVGFCALPFAAILHGILTVAGIPRPAVLLLFGILPWIVLVGLGVVWLGALLVTAPDPSETGAEPPHSARRLARSGLATATVSVFLTVLITRLPIPVTAMIVIRVTLGLLAAVAVAVGIIALVSCLGGRASRIPDAALARRTGRIGRVLRWALPLLLFLAVGAASVSSLQALVPAAAGRNLGIVVAMVNLVAVAFFCVVLFQLARLSTVARQLGRAFRAARDEARSRRFDADIRHPAAQVHADAVADDDDGEGVAG